MRGCKLGGTGNLLAKGNETPPRSQVSKSTSILDRLAHWQKSSRHLYLGIVLGSLRPGWVVVRIERQAGLKGWVDLPVPRWYS
jgi:hypothetical protein